MPGRDQHGSTTQDTSQFSKWLSRIAVADGAMVSHEPVGVFEMVTKSAVRKTLVTSSMPSSSPTKASSGSDPLTYVPGPPTGDPTLNFIALGLGVGSDLTGIGRRA